MKYSNKTKSIIETILSISKYAEKNNLWYFFGGGLAIGLQKGALYRNHDDVDFYPLDIHTDTWKSYFKNKGFIVNEKSEFVDFPFAFVASKEDVFVEALPVKILEDKAIAMNWRGESYGKFYNKTLSDIKVVNFNNQVVHVESYVTVLNQKLIESHRDKKPLREKDVKDFQICGIDPQEMRKKFDYAKYK